MYLVAIWGRKGDEDCGAGFGSVRRVMRVLDNNGLVLMNPLRPLYRPYYFATKSLLIVAGGLVKLCEKRTIFKRDCVDSFRGSLYYYKH